MRKLALYTCIASALTLLRPLAKLAATIRQLPPTGIWGDVSIVSGTAFFSIIGAVVLLFYFALYRDRGMLHASTRLRLLCRAAAFLLGIMLAVNLPSRLSALAIDWTNAMGLDWRSGGAAISTAVQDPFTLAIANNVLDLLSSVLSIALLIVLSRVPVEVLPEATPVGRLLGEVSAVTLILLGLVFLGQLIGLAAAPYSYSQIRDLAYQVGRTPPRLVDFVVPLIRGVALGACGLLVPFLVYRSSLKRGEDSEGSHAS
jgi:hypothetical protein